MTQIALHLNESSIADDMEFYLTDRWDKHNQVRPAADIVNMTTDSPLLRSYPVRGVISNFLYPLPHNSIERIYIGPSIKLFSNHWGVSFLTQLLKLLEPDGRIVLPVHPEGRSVEKGWWSRTSLEVSFQNRSGWRGFSNITAEHDGVMSLRVGCRWPKHTPSTVEWFFQERGNLTLDHALTEGPSLEQADIAAYFRERALECWATSYHSAVIESVVLDRFRDKKISLCHIDASSVMLAVELMLSPKLRIANAEVRLGTQGCLQTCGRLGHHYHNEIGNRMVLVPHGGEGDADAYELVVITAPPTGFSAQCLKTAWNNVKPGGMMIVETTRGETVDAASLSDARGVSWYAGDATCRIENRGNDRAYCVISRAG